MAKFKSLESPRFDQALEGLMSSLKAEYVILKKKRFHVLSVGESGYIWIIFSGWMLAVRSSPQGRVKGMGLFGPGDILGVSGLGGNSRDVPLYAVTDTLVKRAFTQDLRRAMKDDARLCQYMLNYICRRYAELLDELEDSTLLPLGDRVRSFQNKISEKVPGTAHISLSEQVVAWAVGAHPVSVCRALKGE
ncbi:MAG: Crp/Fnr family transcriptional regulator [Clostridia bacterium]|nr:Crp/Fnr family transcriptional regulator [Clostridia bacterium]